MENIILKIAANKKEGNTKKVAAAMGWQLRENGFCNARAIRAEAVNVAIKALAIVNERVKPAGIEFAVDPTLSEATDANDPSAVALSMLIQEAPTGKPEQMIDYKVSGKPGGEKEIVSKLAGAIAAPIREGKGVCLNCIGATSVHRAISAATLAKGYIYSNGLEAIIVPKWHTLKSDSGVVSMLQIEFWGLRK